VQFHGREQEGHRHRSHDVLHAQAHMSAALLGTLPWFEVGAALEKVSFPAPLWEYLAGDVHDKLNADLTVQVKAG